MADLKMQWQSTFLKILENADYANLLKDAALNQNLTSWTQLITRTVVESFRSLGYYAAAKGYQHQSFPIKRSEYLSIDIIAFSKNQAKWSFPVAVAELENSKKDDKVAYSLWKVLCIQTDLRVVFCYRRTPDECSDIVRYVRNEVVMALDIEKRFNLIGETVIVAGTKGAVETFPYGFFKWWVLEKNTSTFKLI